MKEQMRKKGYVEWKIGRILCAMAKVPKEDKRRVFWAIINKHGHSADAVLAEVEKNVGRRKRRERNEELELLTLEAMTDSVFARF